MSYFTGKKTHLDLNTKKNYNDNLTRKSSTRICFISNLNKFTEFSCQNHILFSCEKKWNGGHLTQYWYNKGTTYISFSFFNRIVTFFNRYIFYLFHQTTKNILVLLRGPIQKNENYKFSVCTQTIWAAQLNLHWSRIAFMRKETRDDTVRPVW